MKLALLLFYKNSIKIYFYQHVEIKHFSKSKLETGENYHKLQDSVLLKPFQM